MITQLPNNPTSSLVLLFCIIVLMFPPFNTLLYVCLQTDLSICFIIAISMVLNVSLFLFPIIHVPSHFVSVKV